MSVSPAPAIERSARRRIAIRLLPFLWWLYVIAFLDRVNVAYAALEMSHNLGFSDRVFGLGAGIFFIGYLLLEIPGALIVERWSARLWIARIMITWGIITVLVGFVHTPRQFYTVRFFLGAAEAGFFPGVIVYLTHWFSRRDLAKAIGSFMVAQPLANFVGSPFAGRILQIHWYGLVGWRWLFILEGIPAVIFGIVTFFYLTDRPSEAKWLPEKEREWITQELSWERAKKKAVRSYTIAQALRERDVLLLTMIYFLANTGFYGFTIWFPTILKRASGLTTGMVTLLVAIPYFAALTATLLNSWHSDRTQERRWHAAGPLFVGSVAMLLAIVAESHLWIQLAFFSLFASCVYGYQPCFLGTADIDIGRIRSRRFHWFD